MIETLDTVLEQIRAERSYQDRTYGTEDLPHGIGYAHQRWAANNALIELNRAVGANALTRAQLLTERTDRALASQDDAVLYDRLIKVAAVAVAWAEALLVREEQKESA